ncbi:MAG: cytochrome c biogenesis protein DipZ, partial [bacterium]
RKAVRDLGVTYPVALDDRFAIWGALKNQYWPAQYLADATGRIRYRSAGEGHDAETERQIRMLLAESDHRPSEGLVTGLDRVAGGAEAASSEAARSPETYIGYRRAERFSSPQPISPDVAQTFSAPDHLELNQWNLSGTWQVGREAAILRTSGGRIAYRFRGRDLHLVMGPAITGHPVRFRILIDGRAPMVDHGMDAAANGMGTVTTQRLYQLVRVKSGTGEHTFEIEFLDPGIAAYAFTFG